MRCLTHRTSPTPRPGLKVLGAIERYLDLRLDRSLLGRKLGSSERGGKQAPVSKLEKSLLKRAVAPCAGELGYRW